LLGLKHNTNFLVDYDPSWAEEFAEERGRIAAVLGDIPKGIEHFGSTSVPGMRAKPILDIIIGLEPISDWLACLDPLISIGYDYVENAGVPGSYVFGRGRDLSERTHLVHLVEWMGPSWVSNLALRDALRRDPDLRRAYIAEKEKAAAGAPDNRKHYIELKRGFIDRTKASLA